MKQIIPHLVVNSVEETISFYKQHLNFEADYIQKDNKEESVFAILKNKNVEVMIGKVSDGMSGLSGFEQISSSSILYFESENVADLYERIKNNVWVIRPISETPWGTKEFWIYDNNNYVLAFFKHLK